MRSADAFGKLTRKVRVLAKSSAIVSVPYSAKR